MVQRSTSDDFSTDLTTFTVSTRTDHFEDTTVQDAGEYYYRVYATNALCSDPQDSGTGSDFDAAGPAVAQQFQPCDTPPGTQPAPPAPATTAPVAVGRVVLIEINIQKSGMPLDFNDQAVQTVLQADFNAAFTVNSPDKVVIKVQEYTDDPPANLGWTKANGQTVWRSYVTWEAGRIGYTNSGSPHTKLDGSKLSNASLPYADSQAAANQIYADALAHETISNGSAGGSDTLSAPDGDIESGTLPDGEHPFTAAYADFNTKYPKLIFSK